MSRLVTSNVVLTETGRDIYFNESGQIDMDLVMEATKVMYGFLETINTLQLEKVDFKYIEKVLADIK